MPEDDIVNMSLVFVAESRARQQSMRNILPTGVIGLSPNKRLSNIGRMTTDIQRLSQPINNAPQQPNSKALPSQEIQNIFKESQQHGILDSNYRMSNSKSKKPIRLPKMHP